jgi:beta-glucosidase
MFRSPPSLTTINVNRSPRRFGTYSVSDAVNAGLDLEMPGPSNYRGKLLKLNLGARKVTMDTIDERVRNVLNVVNHAIKSGVPENAKETTNDTKSTSQLLRQIATDSIVLLKNKKKVLPLKKDRTVYDHSL